MVVSNIEGGRYVSGPPDALSWRSGGGCNSSSALESGVTVYSHPNEVSCIGLHLNRSDATIRGFSPGLQVCAACASHTGACGELRSRAQSLQDGCSQCMWLGDIYKILRSNVTTNELQSLRCLPRCVVSFHSINKSRLAGAPTKKRPGEVGPYPRGSASCRLKGCTNSVSRKAREMS